MLYFVVNPVSGNKRAKKVTKRIFSHLDTSNTSYSILYTTKEDGAKKIAKILSNPQITNTFDEKNPKKVVVVGGDGTFSEFLDGIEDFDAIEVGFVAAGRGNDFARTLNIDKDPIKTIKSILKNEARYCDFIEVGNEENTRRCINVCGTGLDVDVLQQVYKMEKSDKLSYLIALKKALSAFTPYDLEVDVNGETIKGSYITLALGNGKYYGGGMKISPNSDLFDGKMNLVLIKIPEDGRIFPILPKFLSGKHIDMPFTREVLCDSVVIRTKDQGRPFQTDGEINFDLEKTCKIVSNKLKILN